MYLQPRIIHNFQAKPILKWAGGKTQIIAELNERIPEKYNKYIEPFVGGGALYFSLNPEKSVIADLNSELINLYKCVANNPADVIKQLKIFVNDQDFFYKIRSLDTKTLDPLFAAARTIFLNKTCFNGLYRVNQKGRFNVPFGRYKNPNIVNSDAIYNASILLKNSVIIQGDYKEVLREFAEEGDLIFLDPPYLPVSQYADFKRYTKEQFYEEDHRELADEVNRLQAKGCYVILTNSNHPLVHELYGNHKIEIIQTKRYINSNSAKRNGEDVIITVKPRTRNLIPVPVVPNQIENYPSTRWMGSKRKLLPYIQEVVNRFQFDTTLDLFSGSGIVSYLFKSLGKEVISNDYMALSATFTKAMIENNSIKLDMTKANALLKPPKTRVDTFVQDTFAGLYFTDEENELIDVLRNNIKKIRNQYERAIALSALIRACTKKRPRGIFTYVGERYNDGRKDLQTSLADQFLRAVKEINNSVFDNGKINTSRKGDAMTMSKQADLIYMDPPYFSPLSDNEYVRRYHFIEGLACDWLDIEIQEHTKTKKFKSYPTPFSTQMGAYDAFDKLFKKFKDKILVVSYSSNSLPTLDEMVGLLSKYKDKVEVKKIDYKYSFGTQKRRAIKNDVLEYIFIAY